MVNRIVVGAVLALCAACGTTDEVSKVPREEYDAGAEDGGAKPGNSSGTRLRRVDRLGADGPREFAGWYDSERDEDCEFTTLDQLRTPIIKCLPATERGTEYVDPACTQPIYPRDRIERLSRRGNPLREYVLTAWSTEEGDLVRMYVPGDRTYLEHVGPDHEQVETYRMGPSDPCRAAILNTGASWVYMDEISIDEFVSWTEVVE